MTPRDAFERAIKVAEAQVNTVPYRWRVEGTFPNEVRIVDGMRPIGGVTLNTRKVLIVGVLAPGEPGDVGTDWIERLVFALVSRLIERRKASDDAAARTTADAKSAVDKADRDRQVRKAAATMSGKPRSRQDVVDRIRKMLALARGGVGSEGDVAAKMALRAMREHAVEQSEIDEAERAANDPIDEKILNVKGWPIWKRALLAECALHAGCLDGLDEETNEAFLYGASSAIATAEYLFEIIERGLSAEAGGESKRIQERASAPGGGLGIFAARRGAVSHRQLEAALVDWYTSAVAALRQRLRKMREQGQQEDPTGTALVLSRIEEVKSWCKENDVVMPEELPEEEGYRFSQSGWSAGQRVPLTQGIGSSDPAPGRRLTDKRGGS